MNLLFGRGQAEKEFKVEVETIGRVRHKNLVRLLGYCAEGAHRYPGFAYLHFLFQSYYMVFKTKLYYIILRYSFFGVVCQFLAIIQTFKTILHAIGCLYTSM